MAAVIAEIAAADADSDASDVDTGAQRAAVLEADINDMVFPPAATQAPGHIHVVPPADEPHMVMQDIAFSDARTAGGLPFPGLPAAGFDVVAARRAAAFAAGAAAASAVGSASAFTAGTAVFDAAAAKAAADFSTGAAATNGHVATNGIPDGPPAAGAALLRSNASGRLDMSPGMVSRAAQPIAAAPAPAVFHPSDLLVSMRQALARQERPFMTVSDMNDNDNGATLVLTCGEFRHLIHVDLRSIVEGMITSERIYVDEDVARARHMLHEASRRHSSGHAQHGIYLRSALGTTGGIVQQLPPVSKAELRGGARRGVVQQLISEQRNGRLALRSRSPRGRGRVNTLPTFPPPPPPRVARRVFPPVPPFDDNAGNASSSNSRSR